MSNSDQEEYKQAILVKAMEKLKAESKNVIDGIMGDLYCEYLPHVLGDTEANLGNRVSGVVCNLIAGKFEKLGDNLVKVSDTYGFYAYIPIASYGDLVRPLCEFMGAEIVGARVKQLESEVESLNRRLEEAYRR